MLENDKREISAHNYEDLINMIRKKFKINQSKDLRFEYWSNLYQDWMIMESLPEDNAKIRVSFNEEK